MKKIIFLLSFFFSFSTYATQLPMDVAVLRGLDKVTGRMSTFSIQVGQIGQFGKTFVKPEACYTHPPEEYPEDSVFLYVFEKSLKGEEIELFKGWMFSSNPALSSMEHPVYDIWVIGCEKQSEKVDVLKNNNTFQQTEDVSEKNNALEMLPLAENFELEDSSAQFVPSVVELEEL
jgi:hypothetical protein